MISLDDRPRCDSLGDYLGDDVPCDKHAGHAGRHEWSLPLTGRETFEWTDACRSVRRQR